MKNNLTTKQGSSLGQRIASVFVEYVKATLFLYTYGRKIRGFEENRRSVLFFSRAGRFYTVGATGLVVNYFVSFLFSHSALTNLWYLQATMIGIIFSLHSNFFLNKIWTFEDRTFASQRTLRQYGFFVGFSAFGAAVQLSLVYVFVQLVGLQFGLGLLLAIAIASIGNLLFNKKWTFNEKIWS